MSVLPQLPTDNLYKFMALSGVVLLAFGIWIPGRAAAEIQLELVEIETQIQLYTIRQERLKGRIEVLRARVDSIAADGSNLGEIVDRETQGQFNETTNDRLRERLHEGKAESRDWSDWSRALESDLFALEELVAELDGRARRVGVLFVLFWVYCIFGMASTTCGIRLAWSGFRLWYERVQRPSDMKWHEDRSVVQDSEPGIKESSSPGS